MLRRAEQILVDWRKHTTEAAERAVNKLDRSRRTVFRVEAEEMAQAVMESLWCGASEDLPEIKSEAGQRRKSEVHNRVRTLFRRRRAEIARDIGTLDDVEELCERDGGLCRVVELEMFVEARPAVQKSIVLHRLQGYADVEIAKLLWPDVTVQRYRRRHFMRAAQALRDAAVRDL